ncbi:unnamed protein product [Parnassius mnemosyne]|uniref:Uncharacterized protein n=1 Tax=Parnassius mnemosyne TaxID=213953 RepID=A0AAV1LFU2_9NEOP
MCAQSTPASRPLSSATTLSELGGYGAALEEALAWLLEAEERLAAQPDPACPTSPTDTTPPHQDLAALKHHFHAHERFLLELSEQQCRIGGVLEEGARLVRDAALSRDEVNEVRLQMRLLNERWEQLRRGAMQRQASVHAALMQAQHHHLQRFRQWLTETEDRMSRMEAEGAEGVEGEDAEGAEGALAAVRALHDDLRRQQPLVDALADCVVVVDDDAHDDGVAEIEDQLRALGERWSHACRWTLARRARLARQAALAARRAAASQLEHALKQMEANPVNEIGEVLERIQELQRVKHGVRLEQRAVAQLLQSHAHEQFQAHESHGDQEPDPALAEETEALLDRLDALLLILDVQASRIRDLGFEFDIDTTEETMEMPTPMDADTSTVTTTMRVETTTTTTATTTSDDHTASKKPRLGDEGARHFQAFDSWARDAQQQLQHVRTP